MKIIDTEKELNDVIAYKERLKDKIEKEKQSIQKIEDKISDMNYPHLQRWGFPISFKCRCEFHDSTITASITTNRSLTLSPHA